MRVSVSGLWTLASVLYGNDTRHAGAQDKHLAALHARARMAPEMWGLLGSRTEIHASGYALC